MKTILLSIFFTWMFFYSFSQDSIFLKDGRVFKCKKIETDSLIVYFTYVYQGSRLRTNVKITDVEKIKYDKKSFYFRQLPDTNSFELSVGCLMQMDNLSMDFSLGTCTQLHYTHNVTSNIGFTMKMIYSYQDFIGVLFNPLPDFPMDYHLFGFFIGPSFYTTYHRSKIKGSIMYGMNGYSMPIFLPNYFPLNNEIVLEKGYMSSFNLDLCYSFSFSNRFQFVYRLDYMQGTNFTNYKLNKQMRGFSVSVGLGFQF